jgi:hypothetical protein
MVFIGAQLPSHPGLDMFEYVDQTFAAYIPGLAPSSVRESGNRTMLTDLENVAKEANANGVTLYMIDAADNTKGQMAAADQVDPPTPSVEFIDLVNTSTTMNAMAHLTGGIAVSRTNNFDYALDTLGRDLSGYYSLGYRPDEKGPAEREVLVRTKNRDYTVRARRTYVMKPAEQMLSERVIANLFHEGMTGDFQIAVKTGEPAKTPDGKAWRVPIVVTVPSTLTLLPEGDQLSGGFTIYIAFGNPDNSSSPIAAQPHAVKFPAAQEAAMRARPWAFRASVDVTPGPHTLSVAVVDQITKQAGFARTAVDAK